MLLHTRAADLGESMTWFYHLSFDVYHLILLSVIIKKTSIYVQILVFERRILRRIFGPTKENQIWWVKTNEELDKLIKLKNVINYIKAQRLSWFGHVQRMPDTRTVKKIFNWKPLTKRSQGRPKYRWKDNIKQDICQMKIRESGEMERGRWEGLNFQLGSSAPGRRRRFIYKFVLLLLTIICHIASCKIFQL